MWAEAGFRHGSEDVGDGAVTRAGAGAVGGSGQGKAG